MEMGQRIRDARIAKGLTQEELGKLVGVQKSAIAKYETGRVVNIKRSTVQKIVSALNIRPSELIFENPPEQTANFHVRVLTDFELMDVLKDYYELSPENQKMVRELISNLKKG
jgi:transcriptional regulator with XRE-family HTH domain